MPRPASKRCPAGAARVSEPGGALPGFLEFCDPTLRNVPPTGAEWLHEIKWDGYRAEVHLQSSRPKVFSRNGLDWTQQFAPIAKAVGRLEAQDAILDGEAVVLGKTGRPDFQALRRELGKPESDKLTYYAFDLLWLDGEDLRKLPLVQRKRRLQELLAGAEPALVYVEPLQGDGPTIYEHACRMGLEGVVSKRANSPYRAGRQESWIKTKCKKSDTYPIVAFVEKLGAKPRRIASLYVGRWDGGRLLYAGKVRSGYTDVIARELREKLDSLILRTSPLSEPVKKPKATWVRPEVEAEIQFGGITDDGLLREAVFKGLREDLAEPKPAPKRTTATPAARPSNESRREKPHIGVPRENILQLLPDAVVPTKDELLAYWRKVGRRALEHLGRRPLKLVRHTHSTTFYHKGPLPPNIPEAVHRLMIEKREGGEGTRLWVDSVEGLLGLVRAVGAVELHPWNASVDDIERPDQLVFDLDPGKGVEWPFVVDTAMALRELLEEDGFATWPKVTGGKGVHVMVPIAPDITHDEAHRYCRSVAERTAATDPGRYTVSASIAQRGGPPLHRLLRNGRGTTAVGAFSPRARPGFPIAAPVSWADLHHGIRADAFTLVHPPVKRAPARRERSSKRSKSRSS